MNEEVKDTFPHEAFARLRERIAKMTPEEHLAAAVRAGIRNPDGSLTESYRDEEEDS